MNRVLVIEDDELILRIIEKTLSKEDMAVETASNGKEALLRLEEADYNFQVIITDIMIPYANGLEIVSKVKGRNKGKQVSVIIISNASNEEVMADAFKLGVDDFLKKPFSPAELLTTVRRLVTQHSETGPS
ncbi:MAG TPA: response regulator transcription factor [Chitinophagaceae bacterium]|jgi:DNA-binding response OmpR family regulator|nr:response regulator transcription factor [Chitinophagaceae bacterium]